MYAPKFPKNFPEDGEWKILYFDETIPGYPLSTETVFVWHHMGQYKLLREKSDYGWKYAVGEMDKYLIYSEWENAGFPFFFWSVAILYERFSHTFGVCKKGTALIHHTLNKNK